MFSVAGRPVLGRAHWACCQAPTETSSAQEEPVQRLLLVVSLFMARLPEHVALSGLHPERIYLIVPPLNILSIAWPWPRQCEVEPRGMVASLGP